LAFLKIDLAEKTVWNIDETWLGMSDFRHMKWKEPGKTNSVAKKQIQPRISMVAGVSTDGDVVTALLQANSNSQIMELFFTHFVKVLDAKRKSWRKDTIVMMDNAAYHNNASMLEFYETLKIPIIFSGPHSYSASPVELFFAHFKKVDVNPSNLKTGKK